MAPWRRGMPAGMLLKSYPWSSTIYDPEGALTLEKFYNSRGLPHHPSRIAVPLSTFVEYGEDFQQRFAPELAAKTLVDLRSIAVGLRATFDDGEVVDAKRVVLAIGVHPFKHVAPALADLPPEAMSHSGDHGPLDRFAGREVVVVGSGASAIDLTALLQEAGASATMVARAPRLRFAPPPGPERPWWRQLARPDSGIGSGWVLWAYANAPGLFRTLPGRLRRRVVATTLGPLGAARMKQRLQAATVRLGCELRGAELHGGRVRLRLGEPDAAETVREADHVIAATGYRIDLARLGFLGPELVRAIRAVRGAPVLSRDYETTVPGLHVIGPAAADSFGPVSRFVFGAYHPSRRLARRFAAERSHQSDPVRGEQMLAASRG